ncbi:MULTISPECIES: MFS transporter [unclassified Devosia]|uniref:MFS transporter n=1 Tax=unclassified Devosia TaxID=196773 RepID=UPI00145F5CC6|nr:MULTISPECIES: MFS transporter [unclassified Devosia]MBJ6986823.1 MFS transporter [Devosia sp. MC521]QMW63857.1 MFS transporter [Devosia sp. MC521]
MSDRVEGRWAEIFGPSYLRATAIICLGVALLAFNSFLSTTTLPTAVRELDGVEVIAWATTLFLVFAIVGGAGAVLVKQQLGARWALIATAGVFIIGTLIAGFANSMTQVLIGRAIQGLGEGAVAALCFALIPELFPNRLVPKVFGTHAMIWAIAGFGGPAGAGALTEFISWRAAFLVNVPLALIFCVMVLAVVPNTRSSAEKMAFPGIRLFGIGVGVLLIALAAVMPWLEAAGLVALGALLVTAAIWLDRRHPTPMTPKGAFWSNTTLGPGFWTILLLPIAGTMSAVYVVMLLQQLWDFGPTLAGAFAAFMSMAWSASSIAVANIKKRSTRKIFICIGPLLVAIGLITVLIGLQLTSPPIVAVAQIFIGLGFGTSTGYTMISLIESSSAAERDKTSTLIPTTQSAGNAIGAALGGVVANMAGYAVATSNEGVLSSIVPLYIAATGITLICGATALALVRRIPSYIETANSPETA